jgi:hypothetical protein
MALIICPDCGKNFSDAAASCPNCGRPNSASAAPRAPEPEKKKSVGCAGMGCITLIALFIIGSIVGDSGGKSGSSASTTATSASSSASETTPAGTHITKSGYTFCYTVDDFNELTDYFVKKDQEAATQMIASGDCGFLPAGIEVDVTDTKLLSGMVQIRKRGSRRTFWTNMEAI